MLCSHYKALNFPPSTPTNFPIWGSFRNYFPRWGRFQIISNMGQLFTWKPCMQDPNRQNQWRVWCPWANRQHQWRYVHAEAKSPVQMATSLALWEPPVKLVSSMDWGCRATSQAMAVQLMDASVQAKPLLPLAVCLAQGLPRNRYYHWRVAWFEFFLALFHYKSRSFVSALRCFLPLLPLLCYSSSLFPSLDWLRFSYLVVVFCFW